VDPRTELAQGRWPWSEPTLLAPMEGVTHPVLRELLAERGGIGVVCTEFVRITQSPLSRKTLRKHVVRASGAALSVQVMGNDLDNMAEATEMVTAAGADIVDINLGCPAPKVVRKGVGSAMLKDRALLGRVVAAMRARTHLPLSAKIRAGFDDASSVVDIARTVQDAGADFITVHPRRRADFYRGVADWRIIERLVRALSIPVVGNGDAWYAADALRMQRETGCLAVMLGRPALRNPWIFLQLRALRNGDEAPRPTGADLLGHIRTLTERSRDSSSERGLLGQLKEALSYLSRALPPESGRQQLREVLREQTLRQALTATEHWLLPLSSNELDLAPEGGRFEVSGRVAPPAY
jgi:tRNA-dihydrouridine synthase B